MATDDQNADESPDSNDDERATIRPGRNFERSYRLDASEASEFLIALGEQLRDGHELTISDDEWELPFAFGEPVELELPGRTDETGPRVE